MKYLGIRNSVKRMETSERNIEANMNELIGRIEAKYEKMSKGGRSALQNM